MAFERLPETVLVLYAELLDQLRQAETSVALPISGSFVSKSIRGHTYWYLQKVAAGQKTQKYLGPESPELLQKIKAARENRAVVSIDTRRRRELVSMLIAGRASHEPAVFAAVLQVLSDSFVFRLGGVLVGTHAFSCYGNMLGVRFEHQSLRTADIDVAQDSTISVALSEEGAVDLLEKLKAIEPKFVAVPELDARDPSTSFKVRGRDLRVDFVTPATGRRRTKPVPLPHLGVAAQPLDGLDYLIERTTKAAVVGGNGILANVPLPARYALHKMWVAGTRPISEHSKSRKDVAQAEQLMAMLFSDHPNDIADAVQAMKSRPKMWRRIEKDFDRISKA